ncbi:MAG TPA: GNAT family N-acetyltransferase [Allosphingosinicella sp.]
MTVEIATERLILRQPSIDDFLDLHALTASPDMREHLAGFASVEESYKRLLATIGGWTVFGFGTFSVRERATGDYVGTCGLFRMLRGLGADFDDHPEAGWIIAHSCWGRGYATEAMAAALDWFERTHAISTTCCMIAPGNGASIRIAERLGYRPTRMAEHLEIPIQLYRRQA